MPLIAKTGSITLIAYGHLKKLDKVKRIQNEKKEAIDRGRTYQKRKADQYKWTEPNAALIKKTKIIESLLGAVCSTRNNNGTTIVIRYIQIQDITLHYEQLNVSVFNKLVDINALEDAIAHPGIRWGMKSCLPCVSIDYRS